MNKKFNLEYPGIYLCKNGIQEAIIKVERTAPFLSITGLFDLTLFVNENKVNGNMKLEKDIQQNPQNYLFQPLDVTTILRTGTTDYLTDQEVEISNEDLQRYGNLLNKLGIVKTQQALMNQFSINMLQTEVYLKKIRDFNGFPYDYNGPR